MNLRTVQQAVGATAVHGVVKADAYGHGAALVAPELERLGIDGLATVRASELEPLRRAGCTGPLLLLAGPETLDEMATVLRWQATPVVARPDQLENWRRWRRRLQATDGEPLRVVVEVDTGMSRSGLDPADWPSVLAEIRAASDIRFAGLMSHLAESELPESPFTSEQERRFRAVSEHLDPVERRSAPVHLANSSAALRIASTRWTAVRVGGALYGLDLTAQSNRQAATALRPAMSVRGPIVGIREIDVGVGVGYRRRWRAPGRARIALVGVGYGDGFATAFGAGGTVLVRGMRCPIVGQISMDWLTVDVTNVPAAATGDDCVLLGEQGSERIDVLELAKRAGIAAYEVWCGFGRRLPRCAVGGENGVAQRG